MLLPDVSPTRDSSSGAGGKNTPLSAEHIGNRFSVQSVTLAQIPGIALEKRRYAMDDCWPDQRAGPPIRTRADRQPSRHLSELALGVSRSHPTLQTPKLSAGDRELPHTTESSGSRRWGGLSRQKKFYTSPMTPQSRSDDLQLRQRL